jgi:hypothetical protein
MATLPPELINRVASFVEWRTDLARLLRDRRPIVSRCNNCGNYVEKNRFEETNYCAMCDWAPRRLYEKSVELAKYRATWDT